MADIANVVIIGGGVVGAAIASEVSRYTDDVFLLEALPRLGLGTSTRNSGVIHAGIYYTPGSLKAFHCVRAVPMLYEFCAKHSIPHQRTGKLIVADSEEHLPQLEALVGRAAQNGVENLQIVDRHFIREIEPNIVSPIAIYSPSTGIVEAEELIKTLARLAQANGAYILTNTRVIAAEVKNNLTTIRTEREEFQARVVINAAGLFADEVAALFGYDKHTIYPCRGEYAEVVPSRNKIVKGLVYPLPMPSGHGLGVHFTRTTGGALLVGPRHPVAANRPQWLASLRDFEIDLMCNGDVQDRSRSSFVLDGPISAIRHLIDVLAGLPDHPPLAAGEIVTTGTLTRAMPLAPGQTWTTQVRGVPLDGISLRVT